MLSGGSQFIRWRVLESTLNRETLNLHRSHAVRRRSSAVLCHLLKVFVSVRTVFLAVGTVSQQALMSSSK